MASSGVLRRGGGIGLIIIRPELVSERELTHLEMTQVRLRPRTPSSRSRTRRSRSCTRRSRPRLGSLSMPGPFVGHERVACCKLPHLRRHVPPNQGLLLARHRLPSPPNRHSRLAPFAAGSDRYAGRGADTADAFARVGAHAARPACHLRRVLLRTSQRAILPALRHTLFPAGGIVARRDALRHGGRRRCRPRDLSIPWSSGAAVRTPRRYDPSRCGQRVLRRADSPAQCRGGFIGVGCLGGAGQRDGSRRRRVLHRGQWRVAG